MKVSFIGFILFCCALFLFPQTILAAKFRLEIEPSKALEILNKSKEISKQELIKMGFKLTLCEDDYCEFVKKDNGSEYLVMLIFKNGKTSSISIKEDIVDYGTLLKSLSEIGFKFRADKSTSFIPTGYKEKIVDGVYEKTIEGTPPKVAVPSMMLRFDISNRKSCFLISPKKPNPYDNTFSVNYSNYSE